MENLKIIVMQNCLELGEKINNHLKLIRKTKHNYIEPVISNRFQNGEGKAKIGDAIRDKDLYIISDVGNWGQTYQLHGLTHHVSPDEHYQDIIRVISAISNKAEKVNVMMPLLYQSRQDRREDNESLDCAIALKHLSYLGANSIITFDAHNPTVSNAIPNLPFENFYPTHTILEKFIDNESEVLDNLLVIGPDLGAVKRTRYYAEMLGCNIGMFDKRRDLTKVVDGKNPIIGHDYIGIDPKDNHAMIVDDMIASGGSIIDAAKELKKRGAKNIYLVVTFALFTEGIEKFDQAYQEGLFDKLYTTNLSYVPEEIKNKPWYQEVDCSYQIAQIIDTLNKKLPTDELYNGKQKILEKRKQLQN